jgi:predicted house-cleaning noncanonical NTP pyrophosphatase (MazG superfamily)
MNDSIIFSDSWPIADWSESKLVAQEFGVKGASSLALPRAWTLPFALIPINEVSKISEIMPLSGLLGNDDLARITKLAGDCGEIIVRSSVVGESIWDRGTYRSVTVSALSDDFLPNLDGAAREVVASASPRVTALMVQRYTAPVSRGEFGNLQRISKTRDHWEISTTDRTGAVARQRLNCQRDSAADPDLPIKAQSGISKERLFGSIAAWMNNELLRGKSQRLNCEWLTDNRQFYLVQIDEEGEDLWGMNPFQFRVPHCSRPHATSGVYLRLAEGAVINEWDKLKVLDELWEDRSSHKPILFYVRLSDLPRADDAVGRNELQADFRDLIGTAGIIVRTSVAATVEKLPNLPRTECLTPAEAVDWCINVAHKLGTEHELYSLAFVVHRFVAARASAWSRADPKNPIVEVNSLWGLPDALQYCPYDIWEVHVPTSVTTDYPDYKSDMLVSQSDGGWKYTRVKNEVARSNCITSTEARDVAIRSAGIANRLGRACHIMWFVGCVDSDDTTFNMPWYWTEAHTSERNNDRASYNAISVSDDQTLLQFINWTGTRNRQALVLKPTDLNLMRDTAFIKRIGEAAKAADVPVILYGSTLAHAYYQLRKLGCTVVTPTEKERSRIRHAANLGKLVRDKIPARIAARHEHEITRQIPVNLIKGFLISKLLEEALEVRSAVALDQKKDELADLYEVYRAMVQYEGLTLPEIEQQADAKREKAGGFEQRLVLLQTGIAGSDRTSQTDFDHAIGRVLADQTSDDTFELPFSFFGFMELDQPRSILFDQFQMRVDVSLRPDRIEFRLVRSSEQLGLDLGQPMAIERDDA